MFSMFRATRKRRSWGGRKTRRRRRRKSRRARRGGRGRRGQRRRQRGGDSEALRALDIIKRLPDGFLEEVAARAKIPLYKPNWRKTFDRSFPTIFDSDTVKRLAKRQSVEDVQEFKKFMEKLKNKSARDSLTQMFAKRSAKNSRTKRRGGNGISWNEILAATGVTLVAVSSMVGSASAVAQQAGGLGAVMVAIGVVVAVARDIIAGDGLWAAATRGVGRRRRRRGARIAAAEAERLARQRAAWQ